MFLMPYRRLPNTDQARLRALRTAIQQAEKLNFSDQVIAYKTVNEARTYLNVFEKQLIHSFIRNNLIREVQLLSLLNSCA